MGADLTGLSHVTTREQAAAIGTLGHDVFRRLGGIPSFCFMNGAAEARQMLDGGVVAEPQDLDLCMILGAGWPFHLGGITPYLHHSLPGPSRDQRAGHRQALPPRGRRQPAPLTPQGPARSCYALPMNEAVKRRRRTVHTTKVSRKNQVTLPVAALAKAHVEPGDVLRVEVEADGVFRLVRERDPFFEALDELVGSEPGLSEATNLEELRNEWER